jgi:hypothetical protein
MARSEAQKAADKRYKETHKGEFVTWTTKFRTEQADEIDEVIKASGMSRAEFIRWAVAKYKEQ